KLSLSTVNENQVRETRAPAFGKFARRAMRSHIRGRRIGIDGNCPLPFCRSAHIIHHLLQRLRHWSLALDFGPGVLDFRLVQHSRISPPNHFSHGREIILPFYGFNSESPVIRPVRPSVSKTYQRRDREGAADV